jgi:hypothetical protein
MSKQWDGVLDFCTQHRHTFPMIAKLGHDSWDAARATGISAVWRRLPITTVTIALVTAFWLYDYVSVSTAAASGPPKPAVNIEYVPPITIKPLPEIHPSEPPTKTGRVHNAKAAHSAFRLKCIGQNEVDYVAEDVTIRLFTPTPARVPNSSEQLRLGTVVAVRDIESESTLAPKTGSGSATAQSDRGLLVSK